MNETPVSPQPAPTDVATSDAPPRRRRRWVWPAATLVALLVGVGIGTSDQGVAQDTYDQVVSDRDALAEKVETAEASARTAEDELATQQGALDARAQDLDARTSDLDTREASVAAREAAVTQTEQAVAATQIQIGTWTVGVDIEPGTYRTAEPVTSTCYWGIYRSGTNGDDIIQNDIVEGGRPQVTLEAGQDFENGCGVFVKQ